MYNIEKKLMDLPDLRKLLFNLQASPRNGS